MKHTLKQAVLKFCQKSGWNCLARARFSHRLLVLCYHGVIQDEAPWDDPRTWIAVSRSQFELQMRELSRYWSPISLSQLDTYLKNHDPLPKRSVLITFDDGFLNNKTIALDILQKYQVPATVFLTTDLIGTDRTIWPLELLEGLVAWPYETILHPETAQSLSVPKVPLQRVHWALELVGLCKILSVDKRNLFCELVRQKSPVNWNQWQKTLYSIAHWDDIQEMDQQGIEFGAHTISHCNLASLSPEEAASELRTSKQIIETHLNRECFSLAYPFGDSTAFSDSVIQVASESGFRLAFTLCNRRNPVVFHPLAIDRLCVTGDWSFASFQSLISGWRNS